MKNCLIKVKDLFHIILISLLVDDRQKKRYNIIKLDKFPKCQYALYLLFKIVPHFAIFN